MNPIIIHILPQNSTICGGIKVHYQLSELEEELGYNSFVAFPDLSNIPTWFKHKCNWTNYDGARIILKNHGGGLVVGWEDVGILRSFDSISKKVCYVQGEVFINRQECFSDMAVWYSSKWNWKNIAIDGCIVNPFIDTSVFYPSEREKFGKFPIKVLLQARKDGIKRLEDVFEHLPHQNMFEFKILNDVSEDVFAQEMREADIFFAHSYPEGFGLPALEAMASRTLVIGYTGGGGTDFMKNGENCFCTRDGYALDIANALVEISRDRDSSKWAVMAERAYVKATVWYCRERTKNQLDHAIREILG
jgi:hypothetical protein